MSTALSLHIGLNSFDPNHYGEPGTLAGCENDARDMVKLAKSRKFSPVVPPLMTKKATAAAVIGAIRAAAKKLKSGDTFFITYSGHGSQVPDVNGDEPDKMDETWCLYDRMLVDDELAMLWAGFKAGVRIIMLSDSCHSGSVSRGKGPGAAAMEKPAKGQRYRFFPTEKAMKVYRQNQGIYDAVQFGTREGKALGIQASIVLVSGCRDNQLSLDGDRNGLFTETMLEVWNGAKFTGGYRRFRDQIAAFMPRSQQPVYSLIGTANPAFESEQPFSAAGSQVRPASLASPVRVRRSAVKSVESGSDFVLRELRATGFHNPNPGSDIRSWFKKIEEVDHKLGLPATRTDLFLAHYLNRFPGVPLGKSQLLKGTFPTPQALVDNAES